MKNFKLKKWLIPAGLAVVLITAFQTGILSKAKNTPPQAATVINVETAEVRLIGKTPKLALSGSLEGRTSAAVSAKISGRIESVLVEDGQRVKAGQPLVKLESVELANSARIAGDAVRRARAAYDSAKADFTRYQTLYEQNAISRQQLDSAETKLKIAEADLSSALASLSNSEQQYSYSVITAPVDGVVANKTATVGQVVSPGMALMSVENIDEIYAVINVEQKDMSLLKPGQQANILVDTYPGKVFSGEVDIVSPVAGSSSRMFRTKIKISNHEGLLKPGMFVKVQLVAGEETKTLAVPQAAVIQKQGLYYVFVIEGGKAVRRQVEAGEVMESAIEIKSGLKENQLVAISNVSKLKDGDVVQVNK